MIAMNKVLHEKRSITCFKLLSFFKLTNMSDKKLAVKEEPHWNELSKEELVARCSVMWMENVNRKKREVETEKKVKEKKLYSQTLIKP